VASFVTWQLYPLNPLVSWHLSDFHSPPGCCGERSHKWRSEDDCI